MQALGSPDYCSTEEVDPCQSLLWPSSTAHASRFMSWTLMQEIPRKRGNTRWGSPIIRRLDACTVMCYSRQSEALEQKQQNTWTQLQLHYEFQQLLPILLKQPEALPLPAPLPTSPFSLFLLLQSSWFCGLMVGGRSVSTTAVRVFLPFLQRKCVWLYMNVCLNVCVHVLHNLGSCAIPRMHCEFPKSRNCIQISRLSRNHNTFAQSRDCMSGICKLFNSLWRGKPFIGGLLLPRWTMSPIHQQWEVLIVSASQTLWF